jgi:fermentation-respiration switch protein FrsA (DUF1100 family)
METSFGNLKMRLDAWEILRYNNDIIFIKDGYIMVWIWVAGIAAAVLGLLYFLVGEFFYHMAIDAHSKKWFLEPPKKKKQKTIEGADSYSSMKNNTREATERDLDTAYFETHPSEIFETVSNDGKNLTLKGYYFPPAAPSDKWLLFFHGYASSLLWSRRWVRTLSEHGYHVLAPDMRGHGMSDGDYIGMGWDERLDALAWIDCILKKAPQARILLSGVSMGGATVLCAAGETLPDAVKCIIADCGYTSVWEILSYQLKALFHLPQFPFMYAARSAILRHAGYDISRASAADQLKKATKPILMIHGDADTFVPFSMLQTVYDAAASAEKEKLSIPGAGHGTACCTEPDLYWEHYLAFADRYIQ